MASSILHFQRRNLTRKIVKLLRTSTVARDFKRHNYIVLLPEVPLDTPETNSLLRSESLPDFSTITPLTCFNAVGKLLLKYESEVTNLEELLSDENAEISFEKIINPMERYSTPLNYAFGTMKMLSRVKPNEYLNAAKKLHPRVQKSQSTMYCTPIVYQRLKEVNANRDKLTECQQRVVDKYLLESRLSGMDLPKSQQKQHSNLALKLYEEKNHYRSKLEGQLPLFKHSLSHPSLVQKLPEPLVKKMALNKARPKYGPWNITLDPDIYEPFLENCSDRMLRWNVWQARVSLAATGDNNATNSVEIEEIRSLRRQIANLLGYKTFAEMSMETKMAGNVSNVETMITTLHTKSKSAVEEDLLSLQKFAMDDGFDGTLESWDIPYYRNQQKKQLFKLDEYEISQYFPLPVVLNGLFEFCNKLFGITFKDCSNKVSTWHQDVKYFEIHDETGEFMGSFYLDLFARPEKQNGVWLELGKTKNVIANMEPLSYLILNFPPPFMNQPTILTFEQVSILFQKFGQLLQHSLTTVPYSDVSGMNNLEWDVIDTVPAFLKLWLGDYNTIKSISSHLTSGEPMPQELHKRIRNANNHLSAFDLVQELYLSALDLELHSRKDYWMDIMREVWREFLPVPLDKNNSHPCSFREIFCDEFPASYFSHTWAKMVAADIFSAFHEVGLSNEEDVKMLGRRFRDTFLSSGGGSHPGEIFRRFRGRNPSLDALLVTSGIIKSKELKK